MALPNNTGSFASAIGGAGALKAAMDRRGIDSSILDQVSPAGGGSPVAPPLPAGTPQIAPTGSPSPEAVAGSVDPLKPVVRSGEMEIALKALAGTVDTENKIAKATLAGL